MPLSEALLIAALLLVVASIAAGLCRSLPIPYTVVLVVIGMGLNEAAGLHPAFEAAHAFRLSPDLVLFVFLPALIFESGLNLDARRLLRDLMPVLALAVPALLVSMVVVAAGVWSLLGMPLLLALLFGALISATDPVAVIALFKELGAPARLTVLLEGESLLNDATAIVAFGIVLGLISGGTTLDAAGTAAAATRFFVVFVGGAAVGVALGLVLGELLRWIRTGTASVLLISIVMAYTSFIVAEHLLHVSGVMAAACAALTFGMWGVTRIPAEDTPMIRETWELIVHACNSLLFLLVGLSIEPSALVASASAIAVAIALVLLARGLAVYALVPLTTRLYSLPGISLAYRHVMWWGGLKGGLAIAMALAIPDSVSAKPLVLDLTVGVVLFMLLVNASTIRPLMGRLKLDRMTADERAELAEGARAAREAGERWLRRLERAGALSPAPAERASRRLRELLEAETPETGSGQLARHLKLDAVRVEMETLEALHAVGLINQYTFLEMRGLLVRDRERGVRESAAVEAAGASDNLFLRAEGIVLRWLREGDWTRGLLARYQAARLKRTLRRTAAGVITAETALEEIATHAHLEESVREAVARPFKQRLARRRERLESLRHDFPEAFRAVGAALAERVALAAAALETDDGRHRGRLGAKAYQTLIKRLKAALDRLPASPAPVSPPDARELVALVPFFAGLDADALEALTRHAVTVDFLPRDVVIDEGNKGDALYLVARGSLSAHRRTAEGGNQQVGVLWEGQFFGETALLGDHVRTATVVADTACTLVRLARDDVLALAESDERVRSRLEAARAARRSGA